MKRSKTKRQISSARSKKLQNAASLIVPETSLDTNTKFSAKLQDSVIAKNSNKEPSKGKKSSDVMTTSQLAAMFLSSWLVGIVVLGVANLIAPRALVLGTLSISPFWALLVSSGVLSFLGVAFAPVIELVSAKENLKLEMVHWTVLYFVINTLLIWLLARLSEILGMGISSWMVAVILGLILDFLQGIAIGVVMQKVK